MPPRRSTRAKVAEKPKQQSPTLVSDDSDFVGEEEASGEVQMGRGKKRKAPANAKRSGQSAPKKVRGIRGKLKAMVEMPIDILFEIFSLLDPIDLVQLARTNKDLWAILSSPSSIFVWKAARSNIVPTPPDCGEEMSEMQYADLLFGKGCQYCLRNIGTIHRAFFPRKRICNKCIDQQCTPGDDLVDVPSWLHRALYPHVVVVQRKKRGRDRKTPYFFVGILDTWIQDAGERDGTDDDNRKWLTKRLLERLKHAKLCENWEETYARHQANIVNQMVEDRKSRIVEHVKELGWADELAVNPRAEYQKQPDIVKLCQKPLLPHILSGLDSSINEYMERLKQERLSKEPLDAFKKGFPVLRRVRDELVATLPFQDRYGKLHAMAEELALEPAIMNIILNHPKGTEIKEEDLLPTAATIFPDLNNRVRKRADEELLSIVEKGYKEMGQDCAVNRDMLDLATTIFICHSRPSQPEWYDGIIDHKYTKLANFPDTMQDSARAIIHCGGKYRSHMQCLSFAKESTIEFASYLVELCGLDPLTTTKKTMDEMNPIFEAVGSNDENQGRATMTWSRAIQHYITASYGKAPEKTQFELLRGEEMEHARSRIAEARSRAMFGGYHRPQRICAHCGEMSNTLLKIFNDHLAKSHGIVSPTDKDFMRVPSPNEEDSLLPIFWMWPPRLDEIALPAS